MYFVEKGAKFVTVQIFAFKFLEKEKLPLNLLIVVKGSAKIPPIGNQYKMKSVKSELDDINCNKRGPDTGFLENRIFL